MGPAPARRYCLRIRAQMNVLRKQVSFDPLRLSRSTRKI
jgi:hypothetical protein